MNVSLRMIAIAAVVVGLALGVAFGAGVAFGRGDRQPVQTGLTTQQIQQLLGVNVGQASGAQGGGGGQTAGAGGATALLGARSTSGKITAVDGSTVTIETRQGSQKVTLAANATISRLAAGTGADLKEGTTIVASGTRKDDGSFEATAISQVPTELQALITGATTGGGGAGGRQP